MSAYPVLLELSGRRVLVVGAGRIATRRLPRLMEAGADVQVVAPAASEQVRAWSEAARLEWRARVFEEADIRDAHLVMAATADAELNARVCALAKRAGALANRVDEGESDFQLPAIAQTSHVVATVSTRGEAPSAAKRLASELKGWLAAGPDRFVAELATLRSLSPSGEATRTRLASLAEGALLEACRRGDEAAIVELLTAPSEDTP